MKKYTQILTISLFAAIMLGLQFANPLTASAYCNTDVDCGVSGFTGNQTCQGNTISQDYVSYTCVNARTSYSSCNVSVTQKAMTVCPANCINNFGYPTCAINTPAPTYTPAPTTQYICRANSYEKCVGNTVYSFNSCNTQGAAIKTCSASETCQGNACFTTQTSQNAYVAHFTKICSDGNAYWYDSSGTRQEIFQTCNVGDTCQNGQCLSAQNAVSPSPSGDQNSSTAAVAGTTFSKFVDFLKKWYIWIIVFLILTILFVVIFKRLSSNA